MPALDGYDLYDLAAGVLLPQRPALEHARDAVRGLTHAAEAWEVLCARELVPASWLGDPSRSFAASCRECSGRGSVRREDSRDAPCAGCGGTGRASPTEAPHSLGACVALASEPEGIVTAEALAHDLARRARPWIACDATSRRWLCVPGDEWYPRPHPLRPLLDALDPSRRHEAWAQYDRVWRIVPAGGRRPARAVEMLAETVVGATLWDALARKGASVQGRPLRDWPDPYEPLVALWAVGFALDALDADGIALVASEM